MDPQQRLGPLTMKLVIEGMAFGREAIQFWYTDAEIEAMDFAARERIECDTVFMKFMPMVTESLISKMSADDARAAGAALARKLRGDAAANEIELGLLDRYALAIKTAVDESKAACLREMNLRAESEKPKAE